MATTTATVFKPIILRAMRNEGGNFFNLPADLCKDELVKLTRSLSAKEISSLYPEEDDLSGLVSSRYPGNAIESTDKWLASKLASFLAAWERKHPRSITFNLIENMVSNLHFWLEECILEGFVFREYVEDFFPPALPETVYYEAIKYNPVFWAIFDTFHQVNPFIPAIELVKEFQKPLYDTRFVYAVSQDMHWRKEHTAA